MSDPPRSKPVKRQQVNGEPIFTANVEGPNGEPPASVAEFYQPLLGGITDALIDLLSDPEEARRLANNLYEEVKVKFTWQRDYESYLELAGPQ